ncbi:type IV toxin-antitoxin system AbiEi family antitoxin domain-containing protein [uncultured Desulfosarcina sp.]|uniref:type IV toxin-antitoxin system AbiEi family antitoxin domain-containing protein n=1 Tax=uncultured Desulfosarcina sp. TaxID=218289 RepID=UPI0029C80F65|nr:type IV toxin-antitoxin system AbiEi family antitoxin domain-containing protein [uncultured Desulfosarcina sp.]
MSYFRFPRYVSVAEKRARAEKKIRQLKKKNPGLAPVILEGHSLAKTWWGKSWNENLERYADYSNRIGRGRSYVRHMAVLDLGIRPGSVKALVQGSANKPYSVEIGIQALKKSNWKQITAACADRLDSLQDLLDGKFPRDLSHLFMQKGHGLFPSPKEIQFSCSCPDWATMCKHVAAVLYGIGARLDEDPSLFFVLRKANLDDLIAKTVDDAAVKYIRQAEESTPPMVAEEDLGAVFGIDMDTMPDFEKAASEASPEPAAQKMRTTKKNRPEPVAPGDRGKAVLSVIKAASEGIRPPQVAEATGLSPAAVRPVIARLMKTGKIRRISRGLYGPPARRRGKHSANATAAVLEIIESHPDGITVPALKTQSGFEEKKLRNIVFRLFRSGKVRRIGRGVYMAV